VTIGIGIGIPQLAVRPAAEAPELLTAPKHWLESRFDGNGATPDGTNITVDAGVNVDLWTDLNAVTTQRDATASSRWPHWTQSIFRNGTIAGLDFGADAGADTSCHMAHTGINLNTGNDRMIYAWALQRNGVLGSNWINRKSNTDGLSQATNSLQIEINNGSFQEISDGSTLPSLAQAAAEPYILIMEATVREVPASTGNNYWYVYWANTTDTAGVLVDATLSPSFQDNDTYDTSEIGSTLDVTDGRTNFYIGARLIFWAVPPSNENRTPGPDDATIQDIFQYLKYWYLDT
jgi:hypothetical protein